MTAPGMLSAEQEIRWERSLPVISGYYKIDGLLEAGGWTKGQRKYALREASAALSGIYPVIIANDLAEADRRLDVIERVCAAIVDALVEQSPPQETLQ